MVGIEIGSPTTTALCVVQVQVLEYLLEGGREGATGNCIRGKGKGKGERAKKIILEKVHHRGIADLVNLHKLPALEYKHPFQK